MTSRTRPQWTSDDDHRLIAYIGTMSLPALARKLGRSQRAIEKRVYEDLGLRFHTEAVREVGLGLSATAAICGVDEKTVWRWINRGWLRARTVPVRYGKRIGIAEVDLAQFFATIGGLLPVIRPSDPAWRAVLDEARADLQARYITARTIVKLLGYAHHNRLISWRRRLGFPDPAFNLGERCGGHYYERAAVRAWLDAHPHYWTRQAKEQL